jgi:hypothetical protein
MSEERALQALAERIRQAYLDTAINSYEDASANGLCAEGAWECAVDAMRGLQIFDLLKELPQASEDQISSRLPSGSRR